MLRHATTKQQQCPCNRLLAQVPAGQWQRTPLQLMATAGLRLLDNTTATRIMTEVGGRV